MISVEYEVHVENIGWMPAVKDGAMAGTKDRSLRIEAIRFKLLNKEGLDVILLANPQVQNKSWTGFVGESEICGTVGEGLRLEGLQFALRGADAGKFAVQARAENVQDIGIMAWVTNEGLIGTAGGSLRLEALEIIITDAGVDLGNKNIGGFAVIEPTPVIVPVAAVPASFSHGTKNAHVYVAPGHGLQTDNVFDPGCCDFDYTEAGLMLAIAKAVCANLRNWGITVTSEADDDNNLNMTYSVAAANNVGADFYISLHCDYNAAPSGTYPIVYPDSASGLAFATAVNNSVMKIMGLGTRGILARDDYEVSTTNMTSCIFETGSIRADIDKLLDSEKFGLAIAQGIYDAI